MDISDFYQTFFDEADELLADMEKYLLQLNVGSPDKEMLNAIFRAAHSIKGGAGTFGFSVLQETTHILENLLDNARCGELPLTDSIINLFLESKDIMQDQLDAYKSSQEPDESTFRYICEALRQIAQDGAKAAPLTPVPTNVLPENAAADVEQHYTVRLLQVNDADAAVLIQELANLGTLIAQQQQPDALTIELQTALSADDISAVLCFILEPEQIVITARPAEVRQEEEALVAPLSATPASAASAPLSATPASAASAPLSTTPASAASAPLSATPASAVSAPAAAASASERARAKPPVRANSAESGSIRVAVEKVDQIINQVGELIITQAMLSQISAALEAPVSEALLTSIAQLERNARDLQESVMSIRMMPMEYVFSRFPRLVHDLAGKLNKEVELTLVGGSAELDKSLIERIIDPLTHLVRNSLDHGIESAEVRRAQGKTAKGNLTLSAEHQGGNIVIEVSDDGAGLNREKILARAQAQGMAISDNMSDEEVWMLIFAPGFSTAEKVTDVSGRGVGMDVVRRNIQEMGGHVEIASRQNRGSTVRIILPLTLAILDGMSVRVGEEIFVLPLGAVMESLQLSEKSLYRMAGGELMLQVRGEYIPLLTLQHVFGNGSLAAQTDESIAVILQSAGSRYALQVDQLIGQHQVVVKNLEQNYRKVPGVSAATILGDGSVALILDIAALARLCKDKRIAEKSDPKITA